MANEMRAAGRPLVAVLAAVLAAALAALGPAWRTAAAQGMPIEAFRAKTVFLVNHAGGAPLENAADEALARWGRFTLADDQASADIVLVFSKNGIENTQSSGPKKDGSCCDTSYGASFTPGARVRAYLKGQTPGAGSLPFWQSQCGGLSQKSTGKDCIEAFHKQFPR
jgi:hypothetical protein